jgi:hypothetical protein
MPLAPFIRTDAGVHPVIDRADLLSFYRDLEVDPRGYGLWNICSPSRLVAWEVLRERHGIADRDGVPCDLFLWGTGTPPDQRLTRVGGTPWLPRSVPWPTIDGAVLSFLCQFDFRDSRDLVGDLPGDLLLIFVMDERSMISGDGQKMAVQWVSADEDDILSAAEVPEPTHPFDHVCTWGVRYRTADYPSCWELDDEFDELTEDVEWEELGKLPVLWGSKIGGVPYHSQMRIEEASPDFLCQLVSVTPAIGTSWPWADREDPFPDGVSQDRAFAARSKLLIGDLGEMSFYLFEDGAMSLDVAFG